MSDRGTPSWERHESLYFPDGSLVLRAPRPDERDILFRVHKSVLSDHSLVFADMLDVCAMPHHNTNVALGDIYDGVPLVHMPDDAHHLEYVLKILYYQIDLPWTPRSPDYPVLVAPILELSRKYGIDRLRDQIQGHLESDWPQTLQDWDRLEREAAYMAKGPNVEQLDDRLPEPASVIQIARQYGIPSVLPAAFYHLSRLSILDDWDRTHSDLELSMDTTKRTARWALLTAADFRCLLLGKAEMAAFVRECIDMEELCRHDKSRSHFGTGIATSDHCQAGAELWIDVCNRCSQSADPLALLKSLELSAGETCHVCTRRLRAKIPMMREKFWERLGDLFHLVGESECTQSKGESQASGD